MGRNRTNSELDGLWKQPRDTRFIAIAGMQL